MKIINAPHSQFKSNSVVTIGTFDGVHIGHQKIIKRLVKKARTHDMQTVVLTFFPHPRMVLHKDSRIKLLNTIGERSKLLDALGVDHLVVQEFTKAFSRLSAVEFVRDILVNSLQTKHLIIGYDHRFGRNRAANIEDLREFGETYDFKVIEISAQEIDEVAVSSTKIRSALEKGDLITANAYLGYNYMLTGTVVKGKGLGKVIDFPTANLQIDETYKLIPKSGVYAVRSKFNDTKVYGMMNIGLNPTVNDGKQQFIEIHFFEFDQDIYGQTIQVDLLERLRDEQKFDSVDALKAQLVKDRENALNCIQKNHD